MRIALTLAPVLLSGCVSVQQLVQEDRLGEACERVTLEEENADKALVREALWSRYEDARVQAHAFTPDELRQAFDYVPAGLREGRFLLVSLTVQGTAASIGQVQSGIQIGNAHDCCEVEDWLVLDGREDELERLRELEREAQGRRERYSGLLGALRLAAERVGGFAAGFGADLMLIGTLGAIDADLTDIPGARLSPIQLLRLIHSQATSRAPTGGGDEEAAARARAAAALGYLVDNQDRGCRVSAGETQCQVFNLVRVDEDSTLRLSTLTDIDDDQGEQCSFYDRYQIDGEGDLAQAINDAFPEPRTLRQLGGLPRIE